MDFFKRASDGGNEAFEPYGKWPWSVRTELYVRLRRDDTRYNGNSISFDVLAEASLREQLVNLGGNTTTSS